MKCIKRLSKFSSKLIPTARRFRQVFSLHVPGYIICTSTRGYPQLFWPSHPIQSNFIFTASAFWYPRPWSIACASQFILICSPAFARTPGAPGSEPESFRQILIKRGNVCAHMVGKVTKLCALRLMSGKPACDFSSTDLFAFLTSACSVLVSFFRIVRARRVMKLT